MLFLTLCFEEKCCCENSSARVKVSLGVDLGVDVPGCRKHAGLTFSGDARELSESVGPVSAQPWACWALLHVTLISRGNALRFNLCPSSGSETVKIRSLKLVVSPD